MNNAYRDQMEINDLTLLHSVFDKSGAGPKGSLKLEYPPSRLPLDGDRFADVETLMTYAFSNECNAEIVSKLEAVFSSNKRLNLSPATSHWMRTVLNMNKSGGQISSLRELAAGSVQLPDHPCEESVHTASRVLAAHWLELIKAERDEEDRKEQAKLLQLQQAVGNKQAELNEKVGDLQRHLQPDTNRRRR